PPVHGDHFRGVVLNPHPRIQEPVPLSQPEIHLVSHAPDPLILIHPQDRHAARSGTDDFTPRGAVSIFLSSKYNVGLISYSFLTASSLNQIFPECHSSRSRSGCRPPEAV